ncbi:hypothetical protein [Endozoicomonas sp. GU-1]|uniref:hypothetical protein n=1 Tax=Endozoicomonas sp. GU-1 TaxID=3009078 RepID=UPI0022B4C4CB|nr:hypothetical protein [Endozoicomonas sp. GU-1]WBA80061.1 hypothetical protein O2T12_17090 [Endozoicomonas sp. GU-1]WBA87634.1 hypothetical protein O3276_06315 [Endozoicomonas sp. GU-1]
MKILSCYCLTPCIAGYRVVKEESISKKIPGLFGTKSDDIGKFTYPCYVTSLYLDEHVRPERIAFNIAENIDDLTSDVEVSLSEIRDTVASKTREHPGGCPRIDCPTAVAANWSKKSEIFSK